jgi:hypothetical protein
MRYAIVRTAALLATLTATSLVTAAQMQATPPQVQETPPQMQATPAQMQAAPTRVSLPAGTRVLIRTIDSVDSSKQQVGYRFTASLETNLQVEDVLVAPRGTTVYGRLANAQSAGRMSGGADLTLELTDIVIGGTAYPLMTSTYSVRSEGKGSKTAKRVVGGTGLGALIGGIAGGGTGAAIGAVSGAALGTTVSAASGGKQVSVPSESLLEFRLEQPVTLPVAG